MDMDQLAGLMNRFGTKTTAAGDPSEHYRRPLRRPAAPKPSPDTKARSIVSETKDASGKVIDTNEVVFSKHKDVLRASKAWQAVATRMGNIIGKDHSLAMAQATATAKIAELWRHSADRGDAADRHREAEPENRPF